MNVGQDAALNLKSDRTVTTDAEEFYRNFWVESGTISETFHRYKIAFTHALLYRAINGDSSEFMPLLGEMYKNFELAPKQYRDEYVATFCKIILEAYKLGQKIVAEDDLQHVVEKARSLPELKTYLVEAGY